MRCTTRSHGGQTKEVEAKKTLGGFQEEMLPVMSLFCRNSELARNHDNPWCAWSVWYASMGPYGALHAPETDESPELTVPRTFLEAKKKLLLIIWESVASKSPVKICLKWTQSFLC